MVDSLQIVVVGLIMEVLYSLWRGRYYKMGVMIPPIIGLMTNDLSLSRGISAWLNVTTSHLLHGTIPPSKQMGRAINTIVPCNI